MAATLAEIEVEISLLRGENARLREENAKLRAELEAAIRGGKRQAAPFRKAEGPRPSPKKPGRKSGRRHGPHAHREIPQRIDERIDVPLPERCPCCGNRELEEIGVVLQFQTEIPRVPIHRQFDIHTGCCRVCGENVQGRHALQTSDALGAASSQLGGDAHAAISVLNKDLGLSHGKVARLFNSFFGIRIARGTSARSMLRTAAKAEPAYREIRREVRNSPVVVPDETGWRVGGRSAWLHVFVAENATCYVIGDRGGQTAADLLGLDWSGTLIHDGWSPYDQFKRATHQQCVGHLQRRCQGLVDTLPRGSRHFALKTLELIDEAFALRRAWRGHRLDADTLAEEGFRLSSELEDLAEGRFRNAENRKLAKHISHHCMKWFWFLMDPRIDATNYRAEQAIRPAAVNRKVWGGNRTQRGASAQAVLLSVSRTLWQAGEETFDWFSRIRRRPYPLLLEFS